MIPISNDVVSRLKALPDWKALEQYITQHIVALDTVHGIKGSERGVAIEIASRQHAIQTLLAILQPFVEHKERPNTSNEVTARDAGLE